jgi:hypothetical protein
MLCSNSNREWSTGPNGKKVLSQIIALTKSPTAEVRKTAAWVMGQDNTVGEFHRALLDLLKDTTRSFVATRLCNWFVLVTLLAGLSCGQCCNRSK